MECDAYVFDATIWLEGREKACRFDSWEEACNWTSSHTSFCILAQPKSTAGASPKSYSKLLRKRHEEETKLQRECGNTRVENLYFQSVSEAKQFAKNNLDRCSMTITHSQKPEGGLDIAVCHRGGASASCSLLPDSN